MRIWRSVVMVLVLLSSCDDRRVFEKYADFDDQHWRVSEQPEFDFEITDTLEHYSIYCNLRNAESYPFSDFRFSYSLTDTTGAVLEQKQITEYLFDKKSGKPFGSSGLGDIYDHRFMLLNNYSFPHSGKYIIRFEQFMRADTLAGILAVGLRVEKTEKEKK
ncbi:MAG: gliding motility lipoprotein GldH [Cyclobacteriaceae bacterium]|nr:gliding motility lipoprotein GldH [Cyclobacteriaceae bacterium]